MPLIRILALAALAAVVVAGVASASVRDGMLTAARTADDVVAAVTDPSPSASPSTDPCATPSALPSGEPSARPSAAPSPLAPAEPEEWSNHGEAVSAIAGDEAAVATWVNPAGKAITNHGKAVSTVAKSDAGKGGGAGEGKKDK